MRSMVYVPWRPNGGMRDRVWEHCRKQWADHNLIYGAVLEAGQFERAAAINEALNSTLHHWDAICVIDADILHDDPAHVSVALELAHASNAYVSPHSVLRYADEETTERILAGERVNLDTLPSTHQVWTAGFAVSRELWERVRGFDPRFSGYGGEDIAFFFACGTLGDDDPQRIYSGGVTHLHHEDVEGAQTGPRYEANLEIVRTYEARIGDRAAMRALIEARP